MNTIKNVRDFGLRDFAMLCWLAAAPLSWAANDPPAAPPPAGRPVSGVVSKLDGTKLTLESPEAGSITVLLAPDTRITVQTPASFADIKDGDFVASAAMLGSDGKNHAQEVRIFPESMRGVGEGHRPMALPNQTMTNATVAKGGPSMTNATVAKIEGGVLSTVYPGGSTDLVGDPGTPVWRIAPSSPDKLLPGTKVRMFNSPPATDGSITARYIAVL